MSVISLKNDRLLRAIRKEPVDVTPIWIMRQAGRYLPEYRATRARAGSFMNLCKTPALACEVTLQPLQRYALDAAIIFSDILTIPDAMGLKLYFTEGKGPAFSAPLQGTSDIKRLSIPDPEQLSYVYEAIMLVKRALDGKVPLIGFCGSPWTLSVYMLEGQAVPGFPKAMELLAKQPALLHQLLEILAQSVYAHLVGQIKAGSEVVMLFDTWGGMLETMQYETFSLSYVRQIIASLKQYYPTIPIILFTKGGHEWLLQMAQSGCDVLGIDWNISLKTAREKVGHQVALQGNMHPGDLLRSQAFIQQAVENMIASYGPGSGHIFNLGHGITPDVPPEQVALLVDTVHEVSRSYHGEE